MEIRYSRKEGLSPPERLGEEEAPWSSVQPQGSLPRELEEGNFPGEPVPKRERKEKPQTIGDRIAEANPTQNPLLFIIFHTFQALQGDHVLPRGQFVMYLFTFVRTTQQKNIPVYCWTTLFQTHIKQAKI